jgi:hypothetical protein
MPPLPPSRLEQEEKNKIAQLWVTSVAGTALVIVIQTFGADWSEWEWSLANLRFMLDRWIRYAFALWFALYLVLAFLANESRAVRDWRGLLFDILQSIAIFVSLGLLGFVTQDFTLFEGKDFASPLIMAFGTIFGIALWTLWSHTEDKVPAFVDRDAWKPFQARLQKVRGWVAIGSAFSIALVILLQPDRFKKGDELDLALVFFCVVGCLVGLVCYARCAFHEKSFRDVPRYEAS